MILVAFLLLFEEWGWDPLKKLLVWLFLWPMWQKFGARIASLPPYSALVCFAIPLVADELGKLWGLILIFKGMSIRGILVIILAKIIGTALLAWVYHLTEHTLLQLPWFARFHAWWIPWKNELIAKVRNSAVWQKTKMAIHTCKTSVHKAVKRIKTWFKTHFL